MTKKSFIPVSTENSPNFSPSMRTIPTDCSYTFLIGFISLIGTSVLVRSQKKALSPEMQNKYPDYYSYYS